MKTWKSARPKNLLIIMSDEHRRDAMGCMGHALVKTPNLDALAARGTVFENAYTASPICVPTRAALATGQYVHRTGHWDSAAPYAGTPTSWMHAVRNTGADVVSIGKLHYRSTDDDNGFTREILPMHVVGGVGWTVALLRENPPVYDVARELAADVGVGESDYIRYDREVAAAAENWLETRRQSKKPWAAFVSFVTPHFPLRAPQAYMDLYDPAKVDLPIAYARENRPSHPELRRIEQFFDYDRYFDIDRVREARAAYYALISFMDDCVGRVLAALKASGEEEETLVIYTSDHGEMLGDHGFWTKSVMYEASVGVPMIIAGPSIKAGQRNKAGASLLDIAATAADMFGAHEFPEGLPGASLVAQAETSGVPDRTIFSEYHDGGSSTAAFMVRWYKWKYVHYVGHPSQLFNLADDPEEKHDLACSNQPDAIEGRTEGLRRLHSICDPEEINRLVFADQARRIAALGGEDACQRGAFSHTPIPLAASCSVIPDL